MNVKRVAAESHHISVIQKTPQIMELYYISFKRQGCLELTLNRNYHVIFENFPPFYKEILSCFNELYARYNSYQYATKFQFNNNKII